MGSIYLIPDADRIEESMALARQYQAYFEYNDFFSPKVLEDEDRIEALIQFYRGLERDRSMDTLHGAFLDITVHSDDDRIREISEQRVRQCMEIANRLEIRGVIFHTNTIPNFREEFYLKNWLEKNVRFWHQILKEYPALCVFIENMFDEEPDMLAQLAERMKDEERFGVCFDYAHGLVFGDKIEEWIKCLGPYTKHMHINDNDLSHDLHQTVGSGRIDWKYFTKAMREAQIDSSVLIEVKQLQSQKESLEYMYENGVYPCF